MQRSEDIIRIVTSALAAFIAALLAFGYNWVKYHNIVVHMHCDLPEFTLWVSAAAPWVFLVSPVVLALGILWLRRRLVIVTITSAAWLFSVAWPITCIVAWELPNILL